MLGRAAYLCLFPAVLIACGSGEPHNAQVSSVAHRYVAAIASDDGSQICSLLTSDARHQLIYDGGVLAAASHSHSHSCAEAAKLTQSLYPLDWLPALRNSPRQDRDRIARRRPRHRASDPAAAPAFHDHAVEHTGRVARVHADSTAGERGGCRARRMSRPARSRSCIIEHDWFREIGRAARASDAGPSAGARFPPGPAFPHNPTSSPLRRGSSVGASARGCRFSRGGGSRPSGAR